MRGLIKDVQAERMRRYCIESRGQFENCARVCGEKENPFNLTAKKH